MYIHKCDVITNTLLPTTDSDVVIFDHESTTQVTNAREKDAGSLNNSCGIKELSVASIFFLISTIVVN